MTAKLTSSVLVVAFVASGCALLGEGKNAAYTINGVTMVAGGAIAIAGVSEDCTGDSLGICEISKTGTTRIGVVLLAAGLIGMLANSTINNKDENQAKQSAGRDYNTFAHPNGAPGAAAAPPPADEHCPAAVEHWRSERDARKKAAIFRVIWPPCRFYMIR